ncbi:MAG TPA: iron ABC transporter permease [Firmicutes bacterium]|jgi:iron complex transport system permease protein|nr:iron ABC transporter permease [Bacillota bacterium]
MINKLDLKGNERAMAGKMVSTKKESCHGRIITALALSLVVAFLISCAVGRYAIPLPLLVKIFLSKIIGLKATWPETLETVLFSVRLPRILAAMMVGGSLALAGGTYQGLFKNPMVSPDILGASAGAGFGAALAILCSLNMVGIQIAAFVFGLAAVALTYLIGRAVGRGNNALLVLVLTGMVVSTLFSSFISMTKYVADPDNKLPAITFWLMGGLSTVGSKDVFKAFIPILIGAVPLFLLRWRLNALSFGEEEAKALGINTERIRLAVILCSTLLTASSVAIGGMVGWVGLVIPHFSRMIVGPNYKTLLPVSLLIGSSFLLVVDDVARSVFAMEIPLGILTSIIGAPFFVYLLMKGRRGWT